MMNDTMLSTVKIGKGCYLVQNDYLVQRTPDGWRWYDKFDASTGGEWRSTMRDAMLDLLDYISNEPEVK